jgi:hypothetical protein
MGSTWPIASVRVRGLWWFMTAYEGSAILRLDKSLASIASGGGTFAALASVLCERRARMAIGVRLSPTLGYA